MKNMKSKLSGLRPGIKRLNILSNPTRVAEVADLDADKYEDKWQLQAEKIRTKQIRRFRQQLAS